MGITSIIRLQKTVASVLLADSLSLCLVSLMKSAVRGEALWQETEDDLWLIASKALDPANSL